MTIGSLRLADAPIEFDIRPTAGQLGVLQSLRCAVCTATLASRDARMDSPLLAPTSKAVDAYIYRVHVQHTCNVVVYASSERVASALAASHERPLQVRPNVVSHCPTQLTAKICRQISPCKIDRFRFSSSRWSRWHSFVKLRWRHRSLGKQIDQS